jgi:hypothetical protein
MKKLLCSCLAFGALGGAVLTHPTLASASVLLTEEEMDGITAGVDSGPIHGSWTQVFDTVLSTGRTARTTATVTCGSCAASIVIDPATGNSTVLVSPGNAVTFSITTVTL